MNGFFGRILRIDCSARSWNYESIPDSTLGRTLGGKGLGTHLLLTENPQGVDPFSPDNRFIIAVGPVTGTRVWSQSRFAVYSKSPATGGYCESYCGGTLAGKIKACGIDAIVIAGALDSLSWIEVSGDGVRFHDAAALVGTECYGAEDHMVERSGPGAGAMVIGPAGENRVAFACIKSDRHRSLGRGGMGAVLGSKNIKGMTFTGNAVAAVADEVAIREWNKLIGSHSRSATAAVYQQVGTPTQVAVTNANKCFPTRYWQSGTLDGWENLSGDYLRANFDVSRNGCPNCFLQCTKKTKVRHGRHTGLTVEGPEFETIYAIGGLNCIDSLEEVAYLNDLCDRLGLDTMSAGNISAFAATAAKRGKLDLEIEYNQPDNIAELYRMIAHREGVGDLLASGIVPASTELGLEEIAVHVKGLEPAGFDPRVLKGMGLSYATAARGACHLRGTFYKAELSGQVDRETISGKALHHIDYEDRATLFDSLILCRFFRDFVLWDELSQLIGAVTGLELGKGELQTIANEITLATREYNTREGLGPATDRLPDVLHSKNDEGSVITREELQTMIGEYNTIREARRSSAAET